MLLDDYADNYVHYERFKEMFRDMLDESVGLVQVGPYVYEAGRVLENVDPVAFNEWMNSYADALMGDGYVIEGFNDGGYDEHSA